MPSGLGKRILILDDEVSLCEVLKARLEMFGLAVTVCNNSQDGWKKIQTDPPDLILLDIRMPEEDGFTFLRKLRSFRDAENANREDKVRNLPVIVVTGTGEGMKGLFEQERISAFVTKPIDTAILKKLIEETLTRESQ